MNYRRAYVPYGVLLRQHEEAQKLKKVLDEKVTGTVKWFSLRNHYGFIARDDGKGDVFVHQMNIIKSRMNRVYLRSLAHNEKVEFDVVDGKAGPEAANVTGPDGTDVQGVYVIQLRYPIRPNNFNNGKNGGGFRRRNNTSRNNGRRRNATNDDKLTSGEERPTSGEENGDRASSSENNGANGDNSRRNRKKNDNAKKDSPQTNGGGQRRRNRRNSRRNRNASGTKTDRDATKSDRDATKSDRDGTKSDREATKSDLETTKIERDVNKLVNDIGAINVVDGEAKSDDQTSSMKDNDSGAVAAC